MSQQRAHSDSADNPLKVSETISPPPTSMPALVSASPPSRLNPTSRLGYIDNLCLKR